MDVSFNSNYIIYDNGEVWSKNNPECKNQNTLSRKLKQRITNSGYYEVRLYDRSSKKYKAVTVHRLVAEHFIKNPYCYNEVNHKDGNKLNNHVDNLEWVTSSYNKIHHISRTNTYGCMKKLKGIIAYNDDGSLIFTSTREAERNGFNRGLIRKAIRLQILYKGYLWKLN